MGTNIGMDNRLAHLRSRVNASLLPDTCYILAPNRYYDDAGGWVEDEPITETYNGSIDIPCRLDPVRHDRNEAVFGQELAVDEYMLTIPYDAPLEADYQIYFNDEHFEIRKLLNAQSWIVVKRATVFRVEIAGQS